MMPIQGKAELGIGVGKRGRIDDTEHLDPVIPEASRVPPQDISVTWISILILSPLPFFFISFSSSPSSLSPPFLLLLGVVVRDLQLKEL